jgi:hypothetical protein
MFPIATCVCRSENGDNWEWFLSCLRDIVYNSEDPFMPPEGLVFVSDRDKGLQSAVKECFPDAYHSYCIRHLLGNFKNNLTGLDAVAK